MQITYEQITPYYGDLEYINNIANLTGVEYETIPLEINEDTQNHEVTNQIIYEIYNEAIHSLNISQDSKDTLVENIHTNSIASCIFKDIKDFPEEEREELKKIEYLF